MPQFNTNSNENTMDQGVMNSSHLCITRLKRRYSNIDFAACITELCYFLRRHGNQNDKFDQFRVAERALYPAFGAVGMNRVNILEDVLYYWMAANDDSREIVSSPDDRRMCFVRALYESQRGNNALENGRGHVNSARINFVDDRNPIDNTICHWGVGNKFAEVFVGMHPDILLIIELGTRIHELLKGFVAEHCFSIGVTHAELISGNVDFDVIFTNQIKDAIRAKVERTLGILSLNGDGLMSPGDVNFLNGSLSVIGDLEFTVVQRVGAIPQNMSELEVTNLIAEANAQLAQADAARAARSARAAVAQSRTHRSFDYAQISAIIRDIIPAPTNQSHVFGDAFFEDRTINPNRQPVLQQRTMLPTFMTGAYAYPFHRPTPTQQELTAAMQVQPPTISRAETTRVRELRSRVQFG